MPIRKEAQGLYPVNWHALALEIKEGVDYVCLECGEQCRRPGEKFDTQRRTLTISHYFHDYTSREIFVAALCTACHLRHDALDAWRIRRRHQHLRQLRAGQQQFRLTWRLI